jgi:hypothetical protein
MLFYKRWVIEVNGAPGTLYANETYQLQVDFPEHYPMEAPQVNNGPQFVSFLLFTFVWSRKNIGNLQFLLLTVLGSVEWVFVNENSTKFFSV